MDTGIIYCYTNTVNGKCYVGQTVNEGLRKVQHLRDALSYNKQTAFARAIRKYGIDKFQYNIIETVAISLLNDRETYWIEQFEGYTKGYNSTKEGNSLSGFKRSKETRKLDSMVKSIPIIQYDLNNDEYVAEYKSSRDAAVNLGNPTYQGHINKACNGKRKTAYGYKWAFKNK